MERSGRGKEGEGGEGGRKVGEGNREIILIINAFLTDAPNRSMTIQVWGSKRYT